jgi:hypothetical protein
MAPSFYWRVHLEAATIAALAALSIAVVGNVVNFIIARQAQRSALENSRLAAALRASEETVKALRQQIQAAERMRIAAWRLQEAVIDHSRDAAQPLTKVQDAERSYRDAFRAFEDSWVDVKSFMPDGQLLEFAREIRHTCRNAALDSFRSLEAYQEGKRLSRNVRPERELGSYLEYVRDHLDMLIEVVNGVQLAEIRTAFFGDDPTEQRRPWHARVISSTRHNALKAPNR